MFKFKKIFSSVAVMALIVTMVPTVKAHAVNVSFNEDNDTLVVSGTGVYKDIIADEYKSRVRFVEIHQGVSIIAERAFTDYINLQIVTIASSVTYIGSEAFANCLKLEEVDYAGLVEKLYFGTNVFKSCNIDNINFNGVIIPTEDTKQDFYGLSWGCIMPDDTYTINGINDGTYLDATVDRYLKL